MNHYYIKKYTDLTMNTFRCFWRVNTQYQQIRLGHKMRGKPPIYCRTIKERLDELNYKDELYTTRIDIGFPPEKYVFFNIYILKLI